MVIQTRPMHFISGVFKVLHSSREVPGSREISSKGVPRHHFQSLSDCLGRGWPGARALEVSREDL